MRPLQLSCRPSRRAAAALGGHPPRHQARVQHLWPAVVHQVQPGHPQAATQPGDAVCLHRVRPGVQKVRLFFFKCCEHLIRLKPKPNQMFTLLFFKFVDKKVEIMFISQGSIGIRITRFRSRNTNFFYQGKFCYHYKFWEMLF